MSQMIVLLVKKKSSKVKNKNKQTAWLGVAVGKVRCRSSPPAAVKC
jgi:hypothetical protein